MARIWDPDQWLFDMYIEAERHFEKIDEVVFYMDERLPDFRYKDVLLTNLMNNIYGHITSFKSKRIHKVEFKLKDGTTREFLQPTE